MWLMSTYNADAAVVQPPGGSLCSWYGVQLQLPCSCSFCAAVLWLAMQVMCGLCAYDNVKHFSRSSLAASCETILRPMCGYHAHAAAMQLPACSLCHSSAACVQTPCPCSYRVRSYYCVLCVIFRVQLLWMCSLRTNY